MVFTLLPGWFKVPTPLGPYNPDWAILLDQDGAQRLYFVVETKSSLFTDDLRIKKAPRSNAARRISRRWVSENPAQIPRCYPERCAQQWCSWCHFPATHTRLVPVFLAR